MAEHKKTATESTEATSAAPEPLEAQPVKNTADLDDISLAQALLDVDVANARVIDLTKRLTTLSKELRQTPTTSRRPSCATAGSTAELDEIQGSRAYRSASAAQRVLRCGPVEAGSVTDSGAAAMSGPRVLLAITAYNGEAFIARTLDSALRIDAGRRPARRPGPRRRQPGTRLQPAARRAVRAARHRLLPHARATSASRATSRSGCSPRSSRATTTSSSATATSSTRATCVTQLLAAVGPRRRRLGHGVVEQRLDVLHAQRRPRPLPRRPGPRRLAQRDPRRATTHDAAIDIPAGISFCMLDPDRGGPGRRGDGPGLRARLLRGDRLVPAQPGRGLPRRAGAGHLRLPRGPRLQPRGRAGRPPAHVGARQRGDHRHALPALPRPGAGVRALRHPEPGAAARRAARSSAGRAPRPATPSTRAGFRRRGRGGASCAAPSRPTAWAARWPWSISASARARRHRCVRGRRVAQGVLRRPGAARRSTCATGVPSPPRSSRSSRG